MRESSTEPSRIAGLRAFYRGRRVLVTGHTGFKGSWLTRWLAQLGADVHGFALAPDGGRDALFDRASIARHCRSAIGDICDRVAVDKVVADAEPQIVFHLAARALVQQGYEDPVGTFATNTLGAAIVLDAARRQPSVEAVVCVTTDKVYRNREWPWPYRESDELGGLDPYSASKAAAELVARSYRMTLRPKDRQFALATARGGNVIGGGDWSPHRLVPDIVRAIRAKNPLLLRYPKASRPWQHVLDLCHAYLVLGHRLSTDRQPPPNGDEGAWNFGPAPNVHVPVGEFVARFLEVWGRPDYPVQHGVAPTYEAIALSLDPSLATHLLGWRPALDTPAGIGWTAEWYRHYLSEPSMAARLVEGQLDRFEELLEGGA